VLCDINPDDSTGAGGTGSLGTAIGTPYTVWWSTINDNTKFKVIDLTTQSDYQLLIDTPGGITGFVGGEYGIIFKRNSIYRMDYVGSDLIFTFDLLAVNEGTSFPRSIVKVGEDIYYWGHGSLQVIRSGQPPVSIGDGQFNRYLYDVQYNSEALAQEDHEEMALVDSQVVGDYDSNSGCLYWLYRPASGVQFGRDTRVFVYNIKEGRASTLVLDAPTVNPYFCHVHSVANSLHAQSDLLRNLFWYSYNPDGTGGENHSVHQFVGLRTHAGLLKSGIISSGAIVGEPDHNIVITRVRPLSTVGMPIGVRIPELYRVPMTITVFSSNDPAMQEQSSTTATYQDRDDDGWFPLPNLQEGEFFTFDTDILGSPAQLREITFLEIDYEISGSY
jgi:hypothetical protein